MKSTTDNLMHTGIVGIIGKPNVGKSSLLNCLVEEKISITSQTAKTTRKSIQGILKGNNFHISVIDTPGLTLEDKSLLSRIMNKDARSWMNNANLILFVVDAKRWSEEDEIISKILAVCQSTLFLVINKIDLLYNINQLLPKIEFWKAKAHFQEIIPISVLKNHNLDVLKEQILKYIPTTSIFIPPMEQERSLNEKISEIIREKIFRFMAQEIPSGSAVYLKHIEHSERLYKIYASIVVKKESHKAMLIGKAGEKIKFIGSSARSEIEKLLERKVFLQLWVEVNPNWINEKQWLQQLNLLI